MEKHRQPPKLTTSLVLDADQHVALAEEASRASTSVSVVVRSIIRRWQIEQSAQAQENHQ